MDEDGASGRRGQHGRTLGLGWGLLGWSGVVLAAPVEASPDWEALTADRDWEQVAEREVDVGVVSVFRKDIAGMGCLRARSRTDVAPQALMTVLWDVASTPEWSSNDLRVSEVVEPGEDAMTFWQYMDIPGWTLLHDRYWVLRATRLEAPGVWGYRWTRVDAPSAHPELAARAQSWDAKAMQPPVMWGMWRFEPSEGGTEVIWQGCQDIGGAVPLWVQLWAAKGSLPDAVADLVREARTRAR